MSFGSWGVLALLAYLAALVGVSEVAKRARHDASPDDHFLADRTLGTFVLFLTLYATAYSGNSLLGYPGRAYRDGFSFVMATGFMMSIIVVFHLLVPRLRPVAVRHGFVTPGDWIRLRFEGRWAQPLRVAVGLSMGLALANFLLAQLKAMGEVASLVTDGRVPYAAGVVGLAAVVLFYENRGGMRAVAWTDAAQGIVMFLGLGALLVWLVSDAGGLSHITQAVAERRPEAVAVPDGTRCIDWASSIVLMGLASVLYPQAIQRVFAAESARALKRSFAGMTFMPLATTLVVTLIGIAAIARLDLSEAVETDGVVPLLLRDWGGEGGLFVAAALLVFLGALSAIMSTADSCLLSLGSVMSRDLLGRIGHAETDTRVGKAMAAAMLLVAIPIALMREVTLWRLIELKMELLIQCVPAFLIAIHWQRMRAGPVLLGLLAGTAFSIALTLAGTTRLGGWHVGVVALLVNAAIATLGSLRRTGRGRRSGAGALASATFRAPEHPAS